MFIGPNNKYQMVLGSKDADGGVVLLYGTDDPCGEKDWHYQGILQRDNRFGMTVIFHSIFLTYAFRTIFADFPIMLKFIFRFRLNRALLYHFEIVV